jgi:hypothetical protein
VLIMMESSWKNNLNFVKRVLMIHVPVSIIVIAEAKMEGITFIPSLVCVCVCVFHDSFFSCLSTYIE